MFASRRSQIMLGAAACWMLPATARAQIFEVPEGCVLGAGADDTVVFGRITGTLAGAAETCNIARRHFGMNHSSVRGSWADPRVAVLCAPAVPSGKMANSWYLAQHALIDGYAEPPFTRAGVVPVDLGPSWSGIRPANLWHGTETYFQAIHHCALHSFADPFEASVSCHSVRERRVNFDDDDPDVATLRGLYCSSDESGGGCGDIDSPSRASNLGCTLFNGPGDPLVGQGNDDSPPIRSTIMLHEHWHAWQIDHDHGQGGPCQAILGGLFGNDIRDATCTCGGHECASMMIDPATGMQVLRPLAQPGDIRGRCPGIRNCDRYIAHGLNDYELLDRLNPFERRHHTPFQVEMEYACDMGTHGGPEMTLGMQNRALAEATALRLNRFTQTVPWVCSAPASGFTAPPAPPPGTCAFGACTTVADCPDGEWFCFSGCCNPVIR